MIIQTDFDDYKKEFARLLVAIEIKFKITEKELFENEMIKLIKEYTKENIMIELEDFEDVFFDTIKKYSSMDFKEIIDGIGEELIYED